MKMKDLYDELMSMEPPRISTPRGRVTRRERAIPARVHVPKIYDEFFALVEWRILMDGYRAGKLDL